MDFSTSPVRSRSTLPVPQYALYGDAPARRAWFVNVEPLDRRAAARDWTIAPHAHPRFAQLVFVDQGAGTMTLDGDAALFASPAVLVVPAFRIHSFCYAQASAGSVLTIESDYLRDLLVRAPDLRGMLEHGGVHALSTEAHAAIGAGLVALGRELRGDRRGHVVGAEVQLLQILLVLLRDRVTDPAPGPSQRSDLFDRFLALVEERFREQPDIDDLARHLGVTTARLRLACRAACGLSPLVVLHDRVLAEAKRCLVYSSMSVAEIGYALGFDDAAYFSRFVARKLGVAPTEFRKSRGS